MWYENTRFRRKLARVSLNAGNFGNFYLSRIVDDYLDHGERNKMGIFGTIPVIIFIPKNLSLVVFVVRIVQREFTDNNSTNRVKNTTQNRIFAHTPFFVSPKDSIFVHKLFVCSGTRRLSTACLLIVTITALCTASLSAQTTTATLGTGTVSGATTSTIRPRLPDTAAVVRVAIRTTLGVFEAELYRRAAPTTVENFLRYVSGGYYTGGLFHRTVKMTNQPDKPDSIKIEVVQATVGSLYAQYALPPIELETTQQTGIKHLDGTLSMARDEPNTAQFEFFVCIGNQPQLDFGGKRNPDGQGFAAFGRVTKGMEIVRKIHQSQAAGQALMPPILIIGITRK